MNISTIDLIIVLAFLTGTALIRVLQMRNKRDTSYGFFLVLIFPPYYFKFRIQTLPEFLKYRYDASLRLVFKFIAILGALFVHIGLSLYTGAPFFQKFHGIYVWISITLLSLITLVYNLPGELKAVVYTQALRTGVLIFGSAALTLAGLMKIGVVMDELGMTESFIENEYLKYTL